MDTELLRFPNPGSDIDSFIRIYCQLFNSLFERQPFGLDDISRVLIENNLATSSGYMGKEALARSTRSDRSRDPLYNQSKMYSELYRVLGWLHSMPESRLNYRLTLLGKYLSEAFDPKALAIESILGMAYPSPVIEVRGSQKLRPFLTILKTFKNLDNILLRDEMILGPMSLIDDRDDDEFEKMIEKIKNIRGESKKLKIALVKASKERNISINTMHNYTRFPIAVLKWSGWAEAVRVKGVYDRSVQGMQLMDEGIEISNKLNDVVDLRLEDFEEHEQSFMSEVSKYSFYKSMERAGFDISPVQRIIDTASATIEKDGFFKEILNKPVLFSPYQELPLGFIDENIPELSLPFEEFKKGLATPEIKENDESPNIETSITLITVDNENTKTSGFLEELRSIYEVTKNVDKSIKHLMESHCNDNQSEFYPLIGEILTYLNLNCEISRPGVNYQRYDAIIIDGSESIPIEIKSPGEEKLISLKAVRQALENKVILLSRKFYSTKHETSSLVIGYELPNDRSDVCLMVNDIYNTFGFNIGIIDFRNLLLMSLKKLINNLGPSKSELNDLKGIINVNIPEAS